jgi:hypothetical protein
MTSKDLSPIIEEWPYEPGHISVRKIRGKDGRLKIQMRVNLGVLQMEVEGRPDGDQPYNRESLLHYHSERLEDHKRRNGTDLGFSLDQDECREIREEAVQYYHRYLANFVLEDYEAVARDTQRNLEVLELCAKYADEDDDKYALEQYHPYILMMNARSKALLAIEHRRFRTALAHVNSGLRRIKEFFRSYGEPKAYRVSGEVEVLKVLRKEILAHVPEDPIHRTQRLLKRALKEERYEDAARLRDELESLRNQRNIEGG